MLSRKAASCEKPTGSGEMKKQKKQKRLSIWVNAIKTALWSEDND
jgi:hypothetical protein